MIYVLHTVYILQLHVLLCTYLLWIWSTTLSAIFVYNYDTPQNVFAKFRVWGFSRQTRAAYKHVWRFTALKTWLRKTKLEMLTEIPLCSLVSNFFSLPTILSRRAASDRLWASCLRGQSVHACFGLFSLIRVDVVTGLHTAINACLVIESGIVLVWYVISKTCKIYLSIYI